MKIDGKYCSNQGAENLCTSTRKIFFFSVATSVQRWLGYGPLKLSHSINADEKEELKAAYSEAKAIETKRVPS